MQNWRDILVRPDMTIYDVIKTIDATGRQIAVVVDEHDRLLGTVSDGDIRRGILRNVRLEDCVTAVMNREPHRLNAGFNEQDLRAAGDLAGTLRALPVVDGDGRGVRFDLRAKLSDEHPEIGRIFDMRRSPYLV